MKEVYLSIEPTLLRKIEKKAASAGISADAFIASFFCAEGGATRFVESDSE